MKKVLATPDTLNLYFRKGAGYSRYLKNFTLEKVTATQDTLNNDLKKVMATPDSLKY